jgi:hypothetical protein
MNEPYAWKFRRKRDILIQRRKPEEGTYLEGSLIELYTHPVKELTDEEITAISKEIFKDYKNFHHYQIDFAKAILRKAQEK